MRRLARILVTAAVLAAGLVGIAAPATAAEPAPAAPVAQAAEVPVAGASWSAPAFPVDCLAASGQISCTPQNPADVRAQQCFMGVPYNGGAAMLCTTYEGHQEAIRAAGGSALLVQYGCAFGDLVCLTFENFGATAAAFVMAISTSFDTTSPLWAAAVGEWSFWHWAVLIVLFAAMVWSIGGAVVSRDREQLVGAIVRSAIAVPAVPLTLWTIGHLVNALDGMSWYILNRDGPFSLFVTLQKVMWAGGQSNYYFAFLIHSLLMLAMLLMIVVFMFRNLALAVLIMIGPVAWMLFPLRSVGPQWVVRYVSAVTALLLTGPLTIGFFALIVNGLAGLETIWDPRSWALLLGLIMSVFAPFAVFGLFSFLGGAAVDALGSRLGGGATRTAGTAARGLARIPTRLGSTPAGRAGVGGARGGGVPTAPGGHNATPGSRVSAAPASQRPVAAPAPASAPSTPRRTT